MELGFPSGSKKFVLTPSRKPYGRIIARSENTSKRLALTVLKDKKAFPWVALGVGKMIKHEIAKLCSDNVNSLLKSKGKESMGQFPWENLRKEISLHCPTLHKLPYCATTTRVR